VLRKVNRTTRSKNLKVSVLNRIIGGNVGDRTIFNRTENGGNPAIWDAIPKGLLLDNRISLGARALYGILTTYINLEKNLDERVFPSFKELQDVTGCSNPTIGKLIDELVEAGWIGNITNPKRFNYQNNYYLNNVPKINSRLVSKRSKKHKSMSEKAKKRLAEKNSK
jgi:hypothetical protein